MSETEDTLSTLSEPSSSFMKGNGTLLNAELGLAEDHFALPEVQLLRICSDYFLDMIVLHLKNASPLFCWSEKNVN